MSHLPSRALPIKREADSDEDDVVFLDTVPTVEHRPEDYDPECKCRMCKIVKKLLAKCTCEDCKSAGLQHSLGHHANQGEGEVLQSNENVTHHDEVAPTNSKSSSIHNDASTSKQNPANVEQSRSSILENRQRLCDDDKSGDLSLNDDDKVEDEDNDYKEFDQNISDPDYAPIKAIPSKSPNQSIRSKNSKTIKNLTNTISQSKSKHKCPHCKKKFSTKSHLSRHHRTIHLQLKPYYCKWHKCEFVTGRRDGLAQHIVNKHFGKRVDNQNDVNNYIGKREKSTKDSQSTENITHDDDDDDDDEMETPNEETTELLNKTSGYISENVNDDDDDQSRSSTPDYLPRFFDDDDDESESGGSSSDNDDDQVEGLEEDDIEQDQDSEGDYDDDNDGDEDYKASEQDGDSDDDDDDSSEVGDDNDDNSSDSDYVLSSPKSLKRSHAKSQSNQSSKHAIITTSAKKHKDCSTEPTEKRKRKRNKRPKTCPKCRRVLYSGNITKHLNTHKKWGFRCTWPKCGFFYRVLKEAKQHLCADHLQCSATVELLTNAQVDQYFVRLNPKTGETSRIKRLQGRGHNLAGHPQPSKDPNTRQMDTFDCPKCEVSFSERGQLLRHYRGSHQKWKPFYCRWPECRFKSTIHDYVVRHADRQHLNSANREKARKYVGERAMTSPSTQKDPVYEQLLRDTSFNQNCPKCGRNFRKPGHFAIHLGTHKKSGFRCTWQQCGFFYSGYTLAKQHILEEHLKGELVNEHHINRHLVKVEPKTGRTSRIEHNSRTKDTDEDEESSSDYAETGGSKSTKKKQRKAK